MIEIEEIKGLELLELLEAHRETDWSRGFLNAAFCFEAYTDADRLVFALLQIEYPWSAGFLINGQTWAAESFTLNGLELPMENIDGLQDAVRNEIKSRLVKLRETIVVVPDEPEPEKTSLVGGPEDGKTLLFQGQQYIYFRNCPPIKASEINNPPELPFEPAPHHCYEFNREDRKYHYVGFRKHW